MQALAKYNTVFHQILPFFEINRLDRLSREQKADNYVKKFFNKYLLVTLVYGILARKWSLRLLENSLNPQTALRQMLNMPAIHRNTISQALQKRPVEVFRQHYFYLLKKYERECFIRMKCGGKYTAVDASVIRLPQNLCDWADFKQGLKGIKIHVVMETSLDIPEFQQLTLRNEQEITVARKIIGIFTKDRILVFDRAYFAWDFFAELCRRRAQFVIPAKRGIRFEVECEIPPENLPDDVISDEIVIFTGREAKKYHLALRSIVYRDPKSGEEWVYLTNCWDLDSETVVEIYRKRWKIEIFFRWIKQNLKINSFWGCTRNAVEIQIWIALIVYLTLRFLCLKSRWGDEKSPYYFYHFIRDKLLERADFFLSVGILRC